MDEGPYIQVKRHKHKSYQKSLKEVHLPSALVQSGFDHDIADDESHFYEALNHWKQLNLSPAFVEFASRADGLSASLPLLVHHSKDVSALWFSALDRADDEALRALLDLMQKLAHDLRSVLAPSYFDILQKLLHLLPRSLSPEALTALLATLSALFKYILIPSANEEMLENTWKMTQPTLRGCNPEAGRAVAEVWGSLLRRLKTDFRGKAVNLMVLGLDGVEDLCAWAVVYACKSVSQTLHTASSSIISPLIASFLQAEDRTKTYTCIRRVLTALIHHCKNADEFYAIADVLLRFFTEAVESTDPERLGGIMDVVSIACSIRQGSRLTAKHLSAIVLASLSIPISVHSSHLLFATSVLTAGDMSLWIGPGRKLVELSWLDALFGIKLCGALSDLGWKGWKLVELPHITKKTPQLLEARSLDILELLATLHQAKRLEDADEICIQQVQTWATSRFKTEGSLRVEELQHILTMSGIMPSISKLLVKLINTTLGIPDDVQKDYRASPANKTWVLASCMKALAEQDTKTWVGIDLHAWTQAVISKWYWSEHVLGALVSLIEASPAHFKAIPIQEIYPHLRSSIFSHSRHLRRNVLRLLDSSAISVSLAEQVIVSKTREAEDVSLDVQGVRERSLRIVKLEQAVAHGVGLESDLAIRWILAQLKVNLRPLWSSAAKALSALASRYGDLVWTMIFSEMQATYLTEEVEVPEWISSFEEVQNLDDVDEEERTWRDPSGHKTRTAVAKWEGGAHTRRSLIQAQGFDDRFDQETYKSQLLVVFEHCAFLAEKHNRALIPFFFEQAGPGGPHKLPRRKLTAWLTVFSKFTNPKVLHSTDKLRALYITLLSHPDRDLQVLALSCLFTYKFSHLTPHEDTLRQLLDETRWRDELTNLDIANLGMEDRPMLVDVIVRLLFGMMLERKGRSRGADRHASVLTALAGCTDEELRLLVDLMVQPILPPGARGQNYGFAVCEIHGDVSEKQQLGFLNLLGDVLKNLGSRLVPYWNLLLETVVSLAARAQLRIDAARQDGEHAVEEEQEDEEPQGISDVISSSKALRMVRQLSLKRFTDFFRSPVAFDFLPCMEIAFRSFISPRLALLDREGTQAPSALLELFYVWASRKEYAEFLVNFDQRVLPQIYACLVAPGVKPAVVSRVLDIIDRILSLSSSYEELSECIVKPHVSLLLSNLSLLVERTKSDALVSNPLMQRQITILSEISHHLTDGDQAAMLLSMFSPLLRKNTKLVSEKVKADLLKIISSLIPLVPTIHDHSSSAFANLYQLLSSLFQSVRSRQARLALVAAFKQLTVVNKSLHSLADLVESLNAFSTKRTDEPDFDRRFEAFTSLDEIVHKSLTPLTWLPVLYNLLHSIQNPTELAIRTNSSQGMKHFVDAVDANPDTEYQTIFLRKLYPALKNGLRSKNELVRVEILNVIAYAVTHCHGLNTLQEMRILLAGGDEEANFFNNIHHVQLHRRTRALRRLAEHCDGDHLRSSTLAEVFVPLVGNFIASTSDVDHHLVNEAIITTGHMAKRLTWGPYFALVQQYLRLSKVKDASERVYVRTLVSILDNFHFPMSDLVDVEKDLDTEMLEADNSAEDLPPILDTEPIPKQAGVARIADAVNARLLPALLRHLEKRDETEDSLRIPIAIGIVMVAKHLPEATREPQISRLLTILSQVLRSKSQETRDLARETLCKIVIVLGSSYLPVILRELRGALLRGPQLHVLSHVTHALLVHITSAEHLSSFSNLDGCIIDVVHVSAEVIFGEPGKDVQSEGFKTKMREVRSSSSKALDSFGLVAKYITPPKISSLLLPLRRIMQETEGAKTMQQVDDVLRRIAAGLNSNDHLVPAELLVLCHTLISQNSRFLQHVVQSSRNKRVRGDAIVQVKRDVASVSDHYATNSFRFVVFGLDLFNTAFRRGRFDFQDAEIVARLDSIIPVVGNTLYSNNSYVLVQGLKATASIAKCPSTRYDKSLPVFVRQIIDIVKQTGNTESEVVQTAFKSLAIILRDRLTAEVKEKDLAYLLELLSPDIEEPSRQAAVFTMLRAIVARKFVVPEIYDIMDKVSEVMVTNQSSQVQELCRGVLLQFLLDYPQGKGRIRNQMTFLAKNLSYVHESGRQSVMELLSAIVVKFDSVLISEYSDMLFVALVMVIANDDSSKCREMASELVKRLFSRLDDNHRRVIMSHLHSWNSQKNQPHLIRLTSQVYGYAVEVLQSNATPYLPSMLDNLNATLTHSAQQMEQDDDDQEERMDVDVEWQTSYHVLTVLAKVLRAFPDNPMYSQKISWPSVVSHLLFPHSWVRTASCRLLGILFSGVAIPPHTEGEFPAGSQLDHLDLKDIANKLCSQLRSPHLDDPLSLQVVKNLFFIGKCFVAISVISPETPNEDAGDEDAGNEDGTHDSDSDNEAADGDEEQQEETEERKDNPLAWLFSKLSYQARSAYIARRNRSSNPETWYHQPSAIFRWFAAMVTYMEASRVESFLVHIISPSYRITEDDTIRDDHIAELKTTVVELQELIQQKIGTTKFANTYNKIRQGVLNVQRERRTARVMKATTNPQATAKRKLQRGASKKDSRKRKRSTLLESKGRMKRRRDS